MPQGTIETSLMGCYDWRRTAILHLLRRLSEIFAWTVDFFGLQKGDNFKVIYEEISLMTNHWESGRYLWSTVYQFRTST